MAESTVQSADANDAPTTTSSEHTSISHKPMTSLNSVAMKDGVLEEADASKEPEVKPTPEQRKRLDSLKAKRDKLVRNQAQLTKQKHVGLLRLAAVLPSSATDFMDLPDEPDYMPSTIAHNIVPALPHLDTEDQTALMGEANKIIKEHIRMLHEYNEIKDVAQGLIGMIADQRGKRVVDVEGEFGVGKGD